MRYAFAAADGVDRGDGVAEEVVAGEPGGVGHEEAGGASRGPEALLRREELEVRPRRLAGRDVDDDHRERPHERGPSRASGRTRGARRGRRELPDEGVAVVERGQGDLRGRGWRRRRARAPRRPGRGSARPPASRVPEHEEDDRQEGRSRPRPRARASPGRRGRSASSPGRADTAGPCLPRPAPTRGLEIEVVEVVGHRALPPPRVRHEPGCRQRRPRESARRSAAGAGVTFAPWRGA